MLAAPRVLPIVEYLAAENMPADAPRVRPAFVAQNALAHTDRVGVYDFVGTMAVGRYEALCERERVMIGRLVTEIQPQECNCGRTVGKHLHVARNEAEVARVPRTGFLIVGEFEHDMAEPDDLRRLLRRPLCIVDANCRIDGIER